MTEASVGKNEVEYTNADGKAGGNVRESVHGEAHESMNDRLDDVCSEDGDECWMREGEVLILIQMQGPR